MPALRALDRGLSLSPLSLPLLRLRAETRVTVEEWQGGWRNADLGVALCEEKGGKGEGQGDGVGLVGWRPLQMAMRSTLLAVLSAVPPSLQLSLRELVREVDGGCVGSSFEQRGHTPSVQPCYPLLPQDQLGHTQHTQGPLL